MAYRAVIFDLDGTLIDSIEDIGDSMNRLLARDGFPTHTVEEYKQLVGWGFERLVRDSLPENKRDEDTVARYIEDRKADYTEHWADKSRPYAGISELLDVLAARGVKLAVNSNKPDEFSKAMVEKLLPDWEFESVIGSREGVPKKPSPDGALEIAGHIRIPPNEILYVGDTGIDVETAKNAGMHPVGVLWGFRDAEELKSAGAETLIERPIELLKLL